MPPHLHADLLEVPEHGDVVLGEVLDGPDVDLGDDEDVQLAGRPDVVEADILLVAIDYLRLGL